MKIMELIRHYDRDKGQHGTVSESLSPKLVQLMVVFGQLPADATGMALVATAKDALPGVKPGTMLRVLSQLRAVLRVAERDGLIPRAPHITMPHVYDVIDCPIVPSEAHLLMQHLRWTAPKWWPLAMVLTHTGARLSEALRLRRLDITESGARFIRPVARRSKTVERLVPLTKQLRDSLPTLINIKGSPASLLFETLLGTGAGALKYSRARCIAAQLGVAIKAATRELGLPEVRVHDLRHVFAAIVAEQGGDLADIATLLGHTNLKTTLRYRGLVRSRARRLLENV